MRFLTLTSGKKKVDSHVIGMPRDVLDPTKHDIERLAQKMRFAPTGSVIPSPSLLTTASGPLLGFFVVFFVLVLEEAVSGVVSSFVDIRRLDRRVSSFSPLPSNSLSFRFAILIAIAVLRELFRTRGSS
jgi:hypothetical protein